MAAGKRKMKIAIAAFLILQTVVYAGGKKTTCQPEFMTIEQIDKPGPNLPDKNSMFYSDSQELIRAITCLDTAANYNHACGYHWYVIFWRNNIRCMTFPINIECQDSAFEKSRCGEVFYKIVNGIAKEPRYFQFQIRVPVSWDSDSLMNRIKSIGLIPLVHYNKNNHFISLDIDRSISKAYPTDKEKMNSDNSDLKDILQKEFAQLSNMLQEDIYKANDVSFPMQSFGMGKIETTGRIHMILKKKTNVNKVRGIIEKSGFTIYQMNTPEYLSINAISEEKELIELEKKVRRAIPDIIKVMKML